MSNVDVQTGVYTKLTSDVTLMAAITGVFDYVPHDTAYPYVTIGDDTSIDHSTKSANGWEYTLTIHSWSQSEGRAEVKAIMDLIYNSLQNTSLAITCHVYTIFEFGTTVRDPDGITYHGIQRFRILTTEDN